MCENNFAIVKIHRLIFYGFYRNFYLCFLAQLPHGLKPKLSKNGT